MGGLDKKFIGVQFHAENVFFRCRSGKIGLLVVYFVACCIAIDGNNFTHVYCQIDIKLEAKRIAFSVFGFGMFMKTLGNDNDFSLSIIH